jgi:hypothetical protein
VIFLRADAQSGRIQLIRASESAGRDRTKRVQRREWLPSNKARCQYALNFYVIPGRALARTRNLELIISGFRVQPGACHRAAQSADPLGLPRNDRKF